MNASIQRSIRLLGRLPSIAASPERETGEVMDGEIRFVLPIPVIRITPAGARARP